MKLNALNCVNEISLRALKRESKPSYIKTSLRNKSKSHIFLSLNASALRN